MNYVQSNMKTFEDIKYIDGFGNEFWNTRELMPLLEYSKWEKISSAFTK